MPRRWFRTAVLCMAMMVCSGRALPADADLVTINFVNADI